MQPLKEIGPILDLIQLAGYDVTYVYEDLLFINHSDFLVQFSPETPQGFNVIFHAESEPHVRKEIQEKLLQSAQKFSLRLNFEGFFNLKPKPESNEMDILFTKEDQR